MRRHWYWLALLGLLCAGPVLASQAGTDQKLNLKVCHAARAAMHQRWQNDLYQVSPGVSAMMVAAMEGDTAAMHDALGQLPERQRPRWRQLALDMALLGGQPATAKALLDAGADANGGALVPSLKASFYKHVVRDMAHDPRFGGSNGVHAFQKAGVLDNGVRHGPPPLFTAIQCNEVVATRMLLRDGADPMRPARPDNPRGKRGVDPLLVAVMDGNPAILKLLLAHGVQPCVDDRRMAANWKREKRAPPVHTVASIAHKAGYSAALVKRLTCHAPPPAG